MENDKIKTHIGAVDTLLNGGFGTGLHLISGVSGTTKTTFLLQIASKSQIPTVYVNTEMVDRDLEKRLTTITTNVDLNSLDGLPEEERNRLEELTRSSTEFLTIEDGNSGFISINYLKTNIREIKETLRPQKILLVIDSFNEWVETAKAESSLPEKELRGQLKSALIDLSKEFNVTILLSAQRKDEGMEVIEELEFAANSHLVFSWEKSGRADSKGFKYLNVLFKKNRSGPSGTNKIIKFRGDLQEFYG